MEPIKTQVTSGWHLAVMREFIKQRAINGSDVRWSSDDIVNFNGVTVDELEHLAQRIMETVK